MQANRHAVPICETDLRTMTGSFIAVEKTEDGLRSAQGYAQVFERIPKRRHLVFSCFGAEETVMQVPANEEDLQAVSRFVSRVVGLLIDTRVNARESSMNRRVENRLDVSWARPVLVDLFFIASKHNG